MNLRSMNEIVYFHGFTVFKLYPDLCNGIGFMDSF